MQLIYDSGNIIFKSCYSLDSHNNKKGKFGIQLA